MGLDDVVTADASYQPVVTGIDPPLCFGDTPVDVVFDDEQMARIAKALAHPARVAIVGLFGVAQGEARMTRDIVKVSGLAQSTVSEHLRILRDAELLVSQRDGARIWYCLRRPLLREFAVAVSALANGKS